VPYLQKYYYYYSQILDYLNTSVIVATTGGLMDFLNCNRDLVRRLIRINYVQHFALAESRRRVKFYYRSEDDRVHNFYLTRHTFPEDVIDEVGKEIIYMLPPKWVNLNSTKVAYFVEDCLVNLYVAAGEALG
jgi:hypothetical protein